jgi:hypothetical protein
MDQYGDAHYPPATPVPSELHESTVIHTWYSPEWYDPPTGLPVARTVQEIAETGRDVLVSFPWYLSANASSGPSFESMWFQDVVSNKTCTSTAAAAANEKNNTDTKTTGLQKSSSNTMKTQQQQEQQHDLNCTCFGRRGDVEASCYDVSGSPELLERVLGAEIASFFWPCLAIVILKTMNSCQDKLGTNIKKVGKRRPFLQAVRRHCGEKRWTVRTFPLFVSVACVCACPEPVLVNHRRFPSSETGDFAVDKNVLFLRR